MTTSVVRSCIDLHDVLETGYRNRHKRTIANTILEFPAYLGIKGGFQTILFVLQGEFVDCKVNKSREVTTTGVNRFDKATRFYILKPTITICRKVNKQINRMPRTR